MSEPIETAECQCCQKVFIPESEVKRFFPLLCWGCSHQVIGDLAMYVKRLKRHVPPDMRASVCDYMTRKGIMGSILR